MNWILLTLLTSVIESIATIFDRFSVKNAVKNTDTMAMLWGYSAAFMFTMPAIISGKISANTAAIIIGFISGLFYLIAWHFFYKAINKTEVSRVSPMLASIPVFVLVGSTIFLKEYFLPLQYLGMALILVGVVIHAYDGQKHSLINHQAILWILLAALLFAIKNLLTKYLGLVEVEPLNILFWIGLSIFFSNLFFTFRVIHHSRVRDAKGWSTIALATVLEASSSLLFTAAITIGPVSLVSFLNRITIFFVFIISQIMDFFRPQILHEKFNKAAFYQKLIGVTIVLLGSYFLI